MKQESEITIFLKRFERDLLLVRKQLIADEKVPSELKCRLQDSLIDSWVLLKEHISNAPFEEGRIKQL